MTKTIEKIYILNDELVIMQKENSKIEDFETEVFNLFLKYPVADDVNILEWSIPLHEIRKNNQNK